MVDKDGNFHLGDFGISRDVADITAQSSSLQYGTMRFMAPELMAGITLRTIATDIYAFGMTIAQVSQRRQKFKCRLTATHVDEQVYSGNIPSPDLNDQAFILNIYNGRRPQRPAYCTSDLVWQVAKDCWKDDPARRPSMATVSERLSLAYCGEQPGPDILPSHASEGPQESRTVLPVSIQQSRFTFDKPFMEDN